MLGLEWLFKRKEKQHPPEPELAETLCRPVDKTHPMLTDKHKVMLSLMQMDSLNTLHIVQICNVGATKCDKMLRVVVHDRVYNFSEWKNYLCDLYNLGYIDKITDEEYKLTFKGRNVR